VLKVNEAVQMRAPFRNCLTNRNSLRTLEFLASLLLGIVWLKSATAHLGNPYYFLDTTYRYELVGELPGKMIAMLLPCLQLMLGICLVGRVMISGALILSSATFVSLLTAQCLVVSRGLAIDCGCFGAAMGNPVRRSSIALTATLAVIAAAAVLCRRQLSIKDAAR